MELKTHLMNIRMKLPPFLTPLTLFTHCHLNLVLSFSSEVNFITVLHLTSGIVSYVFQCRRNIVDANACVGGMRGTRNKFDVHTLIAGFKENPGWRYTCSINITWLNQFFSPCPGVPLSMAKITRIRYTIITIDDYHVLLGITK